MMEEEKRYVDKTYWDNRYASKMESFEWVIGYESLKAFDIDRFIKKDDSILFPGCGNSLITRDMYEDGYHNLTAIDISDVVIQQMKERDKDYPLIQYTIMDCFNLSFPTDSFDVVIDKSTIDTFLCSEELLEQIPLYLQGICRVLKEGGTLIVISFNEPDGFDMIASLSDDLSYDLAMRRWEQDPSNQEDQGLFSYVYIFKRK
ncbi:hypothetical protein WA171_007225, partial [Blastocystis sp. BT1]